MIFNHYRSNPLQYRVKKVSFSHSGRIRFEPSSRLLLPLCLLLMFWKIRPPGWAWPGCFMNSPGGDYHLAFLIQPVHSSSLGSSLKIPRESKDHGGKSRRIEVGIHHHKWPRLKVETVSCLGWGTISVSVLRLVFAWIIIVLFPSSLFCSFIFVAGRLVLAASLAHGPPGGHSCSGFCPLVVAWAVKWWIRIIEGVDDPGQVVGSVGHNYSWSKGSCLMILREFHLRRPPAILR